MPYRCWRVCLDTDDAPQITRARRRVQMIWNLTDFRAWWMSSARYHWLRATRLRPARDLTNFGDLR